MSIATASTPNSTYKNMPIEKTTVLVAVVPAKKKIPIQVIKCKYCKLQFKLNHEEKLLWIANNYICPLCGEDVCCMPPIERDLFKLQEEFLKNRDPKVMQKFYKLVQPYARSMLLKRYSIVSEAHDQEKYSHMAAWFMIEHYYNNPNFKVSGSFGGYLKCTLRQAVYDKYEKPDDKTVSIDMENDEAKKIYELSVNSEEIRKFEDKTDHINLYQYITQFIFKIGEMSESSAEEFARLLALRTYLKYGERNTDQFFQRYNRLGKDKFSFTLRAMYKELHDLNNRQ